MMSTAEMERTIKVQEVILRAMAGSFKWWEAAEIIGVSDRSLRRWRERHEEFGYDGLLTGASNGPARSGCTVAPLAYYCGVWILDGTEDFQHEKV